MVFKPYDDEEHRPGWKDAGGGDSMKTPERPASTRDSRADRTAAEPDPEAVQLRDALLILIRQRPSHVSVAMMVDLVSRTRAINLRAPDAMEKLYAVREYMENLYQR